MSRYDGRHTQTTVNYDHDHRRRVSGATAYKHQHWCYRWRNVRLLHVLDQRDQMQRRTCHCTGVSAQRPRVSRLVPVQTKHQRSHSGLLRKPTGQSYYWITLVYVFYISQLRHLGIFNRTRAPQKGPYGPENVEQQRDIFGMWSLFVACCNMVHLVQGDIDQRDSEVWTSLGFTVIILILYLLIWFPKQAFYVSFFASLQNYLSV